MVLSTFGESQKRTGSKIVIPTVKYGGDHAMVWGCMGYTGVGELAIVEGIMNAKRYVNILRGHLKKTFGKKNRKCKCSSRQMLIENLKKEWDK
jgi:hypothetical protein